MFWLPRTALCLALSLALFVPVAVWAGKYNTVLNIGSGSVAWRMPGRISSVIGTTSPSPVISPPSCSAICRRRSESIRYFLTLGTLVKATYIVGTP